MNISDSSAVVLYSSIQKLARAKSVLFFSPDIIWDVSPVF